MNFLIWNNPGHFSVGLDRKPWANTDIILLPKALEMTNFLGSEQALAPVRFPDSFAEGAWDKLPKTEGTFDFPFQIKIVSAFHKKITGLSLYLREYKSIFYKLKHKVEINLLSRHVASRVHHTCARYTAVDTSNTDRFASFFLQFIVECRLEHA